MKTTRSFKLASLLFFVVFSSSTLLAEIDYVIHLSIDGLRPDGVTNLDSLGQVPNFRRLKNEGVSTFNARADYDITVTLPNHVTQATSRPIVGTAGHNWTSNSDPAAGATIHSNKGAYVASVFDVAHDNGLRTACFAGKTKFSLFDTSYDAAHGAADITGVNNGTDKLDRYLYSSSTTSLCNTWASEMQSNPYNYTFFHITDLDTVGHASTWNTTPGSAYSNTVKTVDAYLGTVFNLVNTDSRLKGRTAIILTADHGGYGTNHSDATLKEDYTIPFYVWGPQVQVGADLYLLNAATRLNPGTGRPNYSASIQPIRNGDAGNLALDLLGLGAIPGSTINFSQNLIVPEPLTLSLLALGSTAILLRRRKI